MPSFGAASERAFVLASRPSWLIVMAWAETHTSEDGEGDITVVIRHIVEGRDVAPRPVNGRDTHATQIEHTSKIKGLDGGSG